MSIPEPLAETVRLFRDSGDFFRNAGQMFAAMLNRTPDEALRAIAGGPRSVLAACIATPTA